MIVSFAPDAQAPRMRSHAGSRWTSCVRIVGVSVFVSASCRLLVRRDGVAGRSDVLVVLVVAFVFFRSKLDGRTVMVNAVSSFACVALRFFGQRLCIVGFGFPV